MYLCMTSLTERDESFRRIIGLYCFDMVDVEVFVCAAENTLFMVKGENWVPQCFPTVQAVLVKCADIPVEAGAEHSGVVFLGIRTEVT
jgi:hypothetical protein